MHFDRKSYSNDTLLQLYKCLLLPRMIEEKMLLLLGRVRSANGLVVSARKPLRWVLRLH